MMNVVFVTGDADLDTKFAKEAGAKGFKNVKGHRSGWRYAGFHL